MTSSPLDASITTPVTADLVRGALELETTARGLLPHRLPAWARREGADGQLLMAESQPAGVRVVVRTTATTLTLRTVPTKRVYAGLPPRPDGVYDLVVDGHLVAQGTAPGGDTLHLDPAGSARVVPGPASAVSFAGLPAGEKDVEIWLPHDETTVLVGLVTDAPVAPVPPGGRRVWLHHGSSISQGSNATHPTGTWPAVAALTAGVDLVNLGFGGGALLDPFTARALRDTPAHLISVKVGINLVNTDLMRRRALAPAVHGFLDTIREGHPATPLVVVTPLYCPLHEATPGPAAIDPASFTTGQPRFVATGSPEDVATGRLTLQVVRDELARVVADRADDPHLRLVDGLGLYGPVDHEALPLPDGLHPDAATHRLVGERFAAEVLASSGSVLT